MHYPPSLKLLFFIWLINFVYFVLLKSFDKTLKKLIFSTIFGGCFLILTLSCQRRRALFAQLFPKTTDEILKWLCRKQSKAVGKDSYPV